MSSKISKTNTAFTLAEVLITLGIIGIVAAITLPSLINNQRNKALQTALKKAYSRHSEALMLVKAEAGVDNIAKEFSVWDPAKGEQGEYTRRKEFAKMYYSKLNSIGKCKYSKPIRNYNNTANAYTDIGSTVNLNLLLSDGTCCQVSINAHQVGVSVDVNGPDKGPNRLGHDIFSFHVNEQGMWAPIQMSKLYTDEEIENRKNQYISGQGQITPSQQASLEQMGFPCSIKSKPRGNGMGCAWYALNDINPDNSAERYWENLPK